MRLVLIGAPGSGKGTQAQLLAERHRAPGTSPPETCCAPRWSGTPSWAGRSRTCWTPARWCRTRSCSTWCCRWCAPTSRRTTSWTASRDRARRPSGSTSWPARPRPSGPCCWRCPGTSWSAGCCAGPAEQHRSDDTEEVIVHRLQVFDSQTSPLIDHYRADRPAGGAAGRRTGSRRWRAEPWPGCWPVDAECWARLVQAGQVLAFGAPCGYPEKVGYAASRASGLVSGSEPLERGSRTPSNAADSHLAEARFTAQRVVIGHPVNQRRAGDWQ